MAKYSRLRERILAEGIIAPEQLHEAPAADWDDLRLVHDPAYVDAVANGTVPPDVQRRIGFPWSPQMVERARRSVGATIAAARAALDDGVAANLAGGTHHAFADRGEGFCVFNDVAVASRVLQRDQHARRIAIVDLDVHQGNGTAAIFAGDPSVFTFSMHGAQNFPFRKEVSDLDVPLADGTADAGVPGAAAGPPAVGVERAPARFRLLSCGRRSIRGRSTGPAQADHRRPAPARRDRDRRVPARRPAACHLHERRLRSRHRRHRHHSRQHDSDSRSDSIVSNRCLIGGHGTTLSPPDRTASPVPVAHERPDRGHGGGARALLGRRGAAAGAIGVDRRARPRPTSA